MRGDAVTRPPEKSVPVSERRGLDLLIGERIFSMPRGRISAIADALARARHDGRLEGIEEAALMVANDFSDSESIVRAIRALALPEGDAHE